MSKIHDICRNPNCPKRFPKGNKAKSRPLPVDLVNVAAIDAYYAENPEKAHHRSPAHVCVTCRRHVTAPTWRLEHLHLYVVPPLRISPLVLIHPRKSYLVRALHIVAPLASTRR